MLPLGQLKIFTEFNQTGQKSRSFMTSIHIEGSILMNVTPSFGSTPPEKKPFYPETTYPHSQINPQYIKYRDEIVLKKKGGDDWKLQKIANQDEFFFFSGPGQIKRSYYEQLSPTKTVVSEDGKYVSRTNQMRSHIETIYSDPEKS